MPSIINDPLQYDDGYARHGPYINANRYDNSLRKRSPGRLFDMLLRWAQRGIGGWRDNEQQAPWQALKDFHSWI